MNADLIRTIIDLSHALSDATPPFPGDPPPKITVLDSTDTVSQAGERHLNVGHLATCIHCGTHMDAPFHFFARRPNDRPGGAGPLHRPDHAGALALYDPGPGDRRRSGCSARGTTA